MPRLFAAYLLRLKKTPTYYMYICSSARMHFTCCMQPKEGNDKQKCSSECKALGGHAQHQCQMGIVGEMCKKMGEKSWKGQAYANEVHLRTSEVFRLLFQEMQSLGGCKAEVRVAPGGNKSDSDSPTGYGRLVNAREFKWKILTSIRMLVKKFNSSNK